MKIKLVFSLLLFLLFAGILVMGSILGGDTTLKQSVIIEAPDPVIWKHLNNIETYDRWVDKARFESLKYDSLRGLVHREATYNLALGTISNIENIQIQDHQRSISIAPSQPFSTSYIENLYFQIAMETLADGSIQVEWKAEYTIRSLIGRILNAIILKPSLNSFLRKSLTNLKSIIEH